MSSNGGAKFLMCTVLHFIKPSTKEDNYLINIISLLFNIASNLSSPPNPLSPPPNQIRVRALIFLPLSQPPIDDDRQGEAEEAHGEGAPGQGRRSADQQRRRKGGARRQDGQGERRPREVRVSSLQDHGAGSEDDADPSRVEASKAALRGAEESPRGSWCCCS